MKKEHLNVFIVAVARSGSFSLTNAFSKAFDSIPIREPYHLHLDDDKKALPKHQNARLNLRIKKILPEKWVVKTISDQISYNDLLYIKNLSDLTILLGRRNTKEKIESLSFAKNNLTDTWHQNYIYKEHKISNNIINLSESQDKILEMFSNLLNIPITYYEDLYFDDEFRKSFADSLGIKGNKVISYLDVKNKYRKVKTNI